MSGLFSFHPTEFAPPQATHNLVLRCIIVAKQAKVAELVDALDLGSSGATRESSSLSFRTMIRFPGASPRDGRAPNWF